MNAVITLWILAANLHTDLFPESALEVDWKKCKYLYYNLIYIMRLKENSGWVIFFPWL